MLRRGQALGLRRKSCGASGQPEAGQRLPSLLNFDPTEFQGGVNFDWYERSARPQAYATKVRELGDCLRRWRT